MEFLQSADLNYWQLWTPLIGGFVICLGLNLRVVKVQDDE